MEGSFEEDVLTAFLMINSALIIDVHLPTDYWYLVVRNGVTATFLVSPILYFFSF